MFQKPLDAYSVAMVAGCNAALDAGVYYQDDFRDFVLHHMGGPGFEPKLLEIVELDMRAEDYLAHQKAERERIRQKLTESPRGHYVLFKRITDDSNRRAWTSVMSSGDGIGQGGSFDSHDAQPTAEKLVERMVGYEIYCCRKDLEDNRRIAANVAALTEHQFAPGQSFKNYKHPGETKVFSKATVVEVFPEGGQVKLELVRRGTGKRWNATVGAKGFAEAVGLRAPAPDPHPLIVVVNGDGEKQAA